VYTQAEALAYLSAAQTTEDQLLWLSRAYAPMVQAMDKVVANRYDQALSLLAGNATLKKFLVPIEGKSDAEKARYLDTLLFATSGSKKTRNLTQAEATTYNTAYAKQESAFRNLMLTELKTNNTDIIGKEGDVAKEHTRLAGALKMDPKEAARSTVLASSILLS
jgi:hypothetical protein